MVIILWIIFGAVVGWLASVIMKTNGQQGLLLDIVVGIVGAFLGGWIASLLGFGNMTEISIPGFIFALLGAIILLAIIKMVRRGA